MKENFQTYYREVILARLPVSVGIEPLSSELDPIFLPQFGKNRENEVHTEN